MKKLILAALGAAMACVAMAGEASPRWKMFDRRLGVFVHWGVYSVGGWHEQEQMRRQVPRKDYEKYAQRFTGAALDCELVDLPSGFWKKETGKVLHVRDIPSAAVPGAGVVIELQFD